MKYFDVEKLLFWLEELRTAICSRKKYDTQRDNENQFNGTAIVSIK